MVYSLISPLSAGISGGAIGAMAIFLTTIIGMLGYSDIAKIIEKSVWKNFGYRVNVIGSVIGAILGFIYGFLIWFMFAVIYNSFI